VTDEVKKVFVVHNPTAGREGQLDEVRAVLASHFVPPRWSSEIYETTGTDDVPAVCRAACARGASLVIMVGGDGTLVGVANGLVHSRVPLGILPLGTGNYLARALQIPLNIEEAADLLVGEHDVVEVDALRVGERYFFSNVSVGISPEIMNDTSSADKKHFGRLAYVLSMVKRLRVFHLRRYRLTLDGRSRRILAAEVLISSTTLLQKPPFLFGLPKTLSDGRLEVYVVTARSLFNYLRLAWDVLLRPGKHAASLSHWVARDSVRIETLRRSHLVQADGEVIGRTPVEIQLVRKAVHIIAPRPAAPPRA
jgi:diacylglycerol kinase (ATP)